MVQQVKPAMPASHMSVIRIPADALLIKLPANAPAKAAQYGHPHGRYPDEALGPALVMAAI